jgi:hypothetical protein
VVLSMSHKDLLQFFTVLPRNPGIISGGGYTEVLNFPLDGSVHIFFKGVIQYV